MRASSPNARASQGMPTGPRATACIPCQKQKVRCIMNGGKPPCQRCQRRRTNCALRQYNFIRDDHANLGASLIHDIKTIHSALDEMRREQDKPPLPPLRSTSVASPDDSSRAAEFTKEPDGVLNQDPMVEQDLQPFTFAADIDRAPIRSLYQITRLKSLRTRQISSTPTYSKNPNIVPKDIISNGLLKESEASRLVDIYLGRSNYYLYDITSKYTDLEGIRLASPLLLVAICAVGALQDVSAHRLYRICHGEIRRLVLEFTFNPGINLEDLRGLIIASFWLSDISWTVSGLAIRRALEVDLQSTFLFLSSLDGPNPRVIQGSDHAKDFETAIERMKLWYLLYICDQHLSILHARSPMLGNQESIRNFDTYLKVTPDTVFSQRLMSQVSLLCILRAASDLFGVDKNERIPVVFKSQLENFIYQVDTWASKWLNCFSNHPVIGDYPSKAVSFHYHFAKLVVCSYVFRGVAHDDTTDPIPIEFRDIAQLAFQCALSIINLAVGDSDLTAAIVAWPHYFHGIIAYSSTFLIKTATVYRAQIDIDVIQTQDLISQVIQLCHSVECGQHHLIRWIGKGLQALLIDYLGSVDDTLSVRPTAALHGEANDHVSQGGNSPANRHYDQSNTLRDTSPAREVNCQNTFMMPSERMHNLGDDYHNIFSSAAQLYDTFSFPMEGIENGLLLSAGYQTNMEDLGFGQNFSET